MTGSQRRISGRWRRDASSVAIQAKWIHRNQVKFLLDHYKKQNDEACKRGVSAAEAVK